MTCVDSRGFVQLTCMMDLTAKMTRICNFQIYELSLATVDSGLHIHSYRCVTLRWFIPCEVTHDTFHSRGMLVLEWNS